MAAAMSAAQLLRRERFVVASGLALIAVLSWAYLGRLAWEMDGMAKGMAMPHWQPWGALDLFLMFVMWVVMMVAMMVPSAAPMILMFSTVHGRRRAEGSGYVGTGMFLAGYLIVWTAFSAAAVLAQWGLHQAALLSPMMVSVSPLFGGGLLVAAGLFQWTPLKDACLGRCRTPLGFLLGEWRDGPRGAVVMGLRHGAFCTGCCWALMALLFVGGVMNLLWVAALAAFVLAEKVLPGGRWIGRAGGLLLLGWGAWLAVGALV